MYKQTNRVGIEEAPTVGGWNGRCTYRGGTPSGGKEDVPTGGTHTGEMEDAPTGEIEEAPIGVWEIRMVGKVEACLNDPIIRSEEPDSGFSCVVWKRRSYMQQLLTKCGKIQMVKDLILTNHHLTRFMQVMDAKHGGGCSLKNKCRQNALPKIH